MADAFIQIGGVKKRFRDMGDGTHAEVVTTGGGGGTDTLGNALPSNFDTLPESITYNADGTVNTIAVTNGTNTWTQTMGYTAGSLTSISGWVKS